MIIKGKGVNKGIDLILAGEENISFLATLISEVVDEKHFRDGRPTIDDIRKAIEREKVFITNVKTIKQDIIEVGCCWLANIDNKNKTGVIGVLISKQYQNRMFGLCSLELLINYGFGILGLQIISFPVHRHDDDTIAAARSLGFRKPEFDEENPDFLILKLSRPSWKGIRMDDTEKIEAINKIINEL